MKPRTLLVVLAGLACATAQAAPQGATETNPNQPATQPAPDNQPVPETQPAQPDNQPAQADQNQPAQADQNQPAQADQNAQPSQPGQAQPNQTQPMDQNAQPNQPGQAQANQTAPGARAPATAGMGMTGKRQRRMANCPSALPGASTTVKDTADGVELQITAQDPAVQKRLVKLAKFHAMLQFPNWFVKPHSGLGGGPGTIGFCPIVHQDTLLTYAPITNGVTIHIATAPDKVSALQRETHARVGMLSRPAS